MDRAGSGRRADPRALRTAERGLEVRAWAARRDAWESAPASRSAGPGRTGRRRSPTLPPPRNERLHQAGDAAVDVAEGVGTAGDHHHDHRRPGPQELVQQVRLHPWEAEVLGVATFAGRPVRTGRRGRRPGPRRGRPRGRRRARPRSRTGPLPAPGSLAGGRPRPLAAPPPRHRPPSAPRAPARGPGGAAARGWERRSSP